MTTPSHEVTLHELPDEEFLLCTRDGVTLAATKGMLTEGITFDTMRESSVATYVERVSNQRRYEIPAAWFHPGDVLRFTVELTIDLPTEGTQP